MASVIIEEVVEECVEEAVENAVENAVEEAVENAVEEAVEDAVDEAVEQVVEDAVDNAVEESVDEAVDEAVEEGVQQAVQSTWKKKLIVAVAGLIVSITVIDPIIHKIKAATGAGKKKCKIDPDTKKKMEESDGVLGVLSDLLQSWTTELKKYDEKDSLGKVTYGDKSADAGGVVWSLFNDMKEDLNKALHIADNEKTHCQWKANIKVFELVVIKGAYNISAIFMAKDHAPVMKKKNFPPEADRTKMTDAFNKYYSDSWKKIIKWNAKKKLSNAVKHEAMKASKNAVKALIKKPLTTKIKSGIQSQVVPGVKAAATDAGKAETKVVFNEWNSRIQEHLAIPVEGLATLKDWMIKNIKPEAVKKATGKATAAASAVMQLPPAQIKIINISSDAKDQVLRQDKAEIEKTAKKAADDYIKKILAEKRAKK